MRLHPPPKNMLPILHSHAGSSASFLTLGEGEMMIGYSSHASLFVFLPIQFALHTVFILYCQVSEC